MKNYLPLTATVATTAVLLTGCAADEVSTGSSGAPESESIVIGSQDYYSNEILAEVYAQALEEEGFDVERDFRIGQREVYMPEIESGAIDIMPEYSGALLQYYEPETQARESGEVYEELGAALPEGLRVLDQAEATDQDSYVVTTEFAEEHDAEQIGDLAGVEGITLGANSEIESRPYGPEALAEVYGVNVDFTPIEDSGGPLTVQALRDGDIQMADIYTASPALGDGDLTVLEDPENIFVSSNVVPVVSDRVGEDAAEVINGISAELDGDDLVAMNQASTEEQKDSATVASEWLAEQE